MRKNRATLISLIALAVVAIPAIFLIVEIDGEYRKAAKSDHQATMQQLENQKVKVATTVREEFYVAPAEISFPLY